MSNSGLENLLHEIGLASTRDGFAAGIVVAILLQLGFIRIVVVEQSIAIWLLLIFAIVLTVYRVTHHNKSLLSPVLDGFVMGFGWLFALLNITQTFPH